MKRSELKRKTPLVARTPLARSSLPLRRAPLVQRAPMKAGRPKPAVPAGVRERLWERSGGNCEIQVSAAICTRSATDVAHRIARGIGGTFRQGAREAARLSNALAACRACHDYCHRNPAYAVGCGWMEPHGVDPAAEPVRYRNQRWVLLDDEGGITRCAF